MTAPSNAATKRGILALATTGLVLISSFASVAAQSTDAATEAGKQDWEVRLRGAAKELSIARTDQDAFWNSVPASFTFQHDLQNDTQTHSADVFLGVAQKMSPNVFVIPYIGLIKSKHEASGVFDATQSTEQRKIGLSADLYWVSGWYVADKASGFRFIGALERSNDHVDETRTTTASISVRPYVWFFNRKPFLPGSRDFYINPIMLLRLDAVNYSRRSIFPALAALQDNSRRAGGEVGFAIGKEHTRINYSFRYIKLNDWKGAADVSHASHAIEANLDQNGYANVVLRFDRGRAEDSFESERLTSLRLALRY